MRKIVVVCKLKVIKNSKDAEGNVHKLVHQSLVFIIMMMVMMMFNCS